MYQINEEQRTDILKLIDRAPIKGLKEIEAVISIIGALNNKIVSNVGPNEEKSE